MQLSTINVNLYQLTLCKLTIQVFSTAGNNFSLGTSKSHSKKDSCFVVEIFAVFNIPPASCLRGCNSGSVRYF